MSINLKNGQRFGRWVVIDDNFIIKRTHRYVKCRCDCGTEQFVSSADLFNGRTNSCKHCVALNRRVVIPVGTKSKNWTVVGETKINKSQNLLHKVQCDCGNTRWMSASEFFNPDKAHKCQKCAAIKRGIELKIKNGLIGDLDAEKYGKIKKSAQVRKIEFSVSQQYIWDLYESQNRKCAITGDAIPNIKKASLDRIDSHLGYVVGNVQWVSKQANISKHIMSMEELYEFCRKVLNHANQQPSLSSNTLEGSETNSRVHTKEVDSNGDTSAEHPVMDEDIVRHSFEKRRLQDKEPANNN